MTETATAAGTFFIGIAGRLELFQFNIQNRAFVDAGDQDDKVSARDNGLFDLYVQGGTGRDILEMGPGADTIYGDNPGQGIDGDPANGNRDRDAILGGGNNDTIFGQAATTSSTPKTETTMSMAAWAMISSWAARGTT
jgi:hypothetical protein